MGWGFERGRVVRRALRRVTLVNILVVLIFMLISFVQEEGGVEFIVCLERF